MNPGAGVAQASDVDLSYGRALSINDSESIRFAALLSVIGPRGIRPNRGPVGFYIRDAENCRCRFQLTSAVFYRINGSPVKNVP